MSAADTHHHSSDIPCPDPSVHAKHERLSAQASTAALYVTQPQKGTDVRQPKDDVLGKDGKLSSRSAATSLKYAKATDLPSFPSHGGESNAAGAAALLAKDYKMKDLWQPEQSMAGSKAAVKAQKDGGKLDLWQYEGSKNGLSAAALAMRKNIQTPLSPNIDRGYTDAGKNNSLLAATKSTGSSRQRSDSTPAARPPPLYPDERNSARNALSAATFSHRNSVRAPPPTKSREGVSSEANQAARVQNIHMDKDMFGSAPLVEPEVEERKREAALRASAVSMAKKMYDHQNRAMLANPPDDTSSIGSAGADTAHRRNASNMSQPDLKQEAMKYITLQDQAHKLAQERLAKVDKDMENSKYREYYGYKDKSPRKNRLSIRGRNRNRAASEGADSDNSDDEEQARRIRRQMSQLNSASNQVSDKQREEDRARLLKAAEKRVHDRMHDMDEKVFLETGKPSQAMMDDWEAKAREKAEKERTEREKHPGKTHIGGGKYMDQSEIEAIAAARLKPTLDELNDNATKRREREAEIEKKRDQQHTERMEEKMRSEQQKAEFKRIKEQDKATARKEKEDRKAAQREEKARKSEDKRKSREIKRDEAGPAAGGAAGGFALGEMANREKTEDETAEPQQQDVKEKRKSRGMFGRLTDKFKKDDKPATQAEKAEDETVGRTSKETASTAPGTLVVGSMAGTGGVKSDEQDSTHGVSERNAEGAREIDTFAGFDSTGDNRASTIETTDDRDDKGSSHAGTAAAVAAGTAGAGGLAWATSRSNEPEAREDISSVSSDSDDRDLQRAETAHSLQPLQSPAIEQRPDLERHISTIGTSSGEEGSDELSDSDDEDFARGRKPGQENFATTTRAENVAAVDEPVSPLNEREDPAVFTQPAPRPEDDQRVPVPVLSPAPKEREDHPPAAPIEQTKEEAPAPTTEKPTEPAQAPVIATGPSASESKTKEPENPKEEKEEKRGLRGLISRLKGRDKEAKSSDGKLHRNRTSSEQEKGFQGGAKFTSPPRKEDKEETSSTITPVTTTSAGKVAEGSGTGTAATGTGTLDSNDDRPLPLHVGTDGPIGDPEGRVSTSGAARNESTASPTSESSFKRHDAELHDPDDVSSSGAEEEDIQRGRGRGGLFRRKLGFGKNRDADADVVAKQGDEGAERPTLTTTAPSGDGLGKGDGKGSLEGRDGEEQFEEARDTFDESLAPPAAFAGQPKSQSPVRETRFTERF